MDTTECKPTVSLTAYPLPHHYPHKLKPIRGKRND
uniref:Uncharacterized protein n=1 Tax=Rhizophora mucronata TaxID=61149 RepID=A0A2P2N079_RHIMU